MFPMAFSAAEFPYNSVTSGPWEIMHVASENVIFVEDFRVLEDPVGGGPVEASRVSPIRSVGERVLKLSSTPFGPLAPVDA